MDISDLTESLLKVVMETVINASTDVIEPVHSEDQVYEFTQISDFWRKRDFLEGDYIKIDGVLSLYAPTMFGSPRSKRDLHRETRRVVLNAIESNPEYITQSDALLAYTAGQMVVRPHLPDLPYVYMGFYQSIVRNSIPLFVNADYYRRELLPHFQNGVTAIEVSLLGRFNFTEINFLQGFLEDFKLEDIYDRDLLQDRLSQQNYSVQVNGDIAIDGKHDSTYIQYKGPARYLDGDIWVVAKNGKRSGIVSRFIDLSDPEDIREERFFLKTDVEKNFVGAEIVSEFDQVEPLFENEIHTLNPDNLVKALLKAENLDSEKDELSQVQSSKEPEAGSSIAKRLFLKRVISRLPTTQFEELLFVLETPIDEIPPSSSPQSQRAIALLRWAEGPFGCGLESLEAAHQLVMKKN